MTRVLVLVPTALADAPLAGRTLADHWSWRLAEAGLEARVVDEAEALLGATPVVVVDGRYPTLDVQRLRDLQGVLRDGHARPMAARIDRGAATSHAIDHLAVLADDEGEALPEPRVDDVADLHRAERAVRAALLAHLEATGVRVIDPAGLVLDTTVTVAPGATLWPTVVLRGSTVIESGAEIRPGCWIEDSRVGEGSVVKPHCVLTEADVGPGCQVGPMAHLRPRAVLRGHNKVGNFVEVKKTTLEPRAQASHLAYLGDGHVGEAANIGAGTIFCNYNGFQKFRTEIGAGAFIGSNTALVAPVSVGAGAIVGAGSVIAKPVPDDALAVTRADQRTLDGAGAKLRDRNRAKAERAGATKR